ncbi:LysR family transcriptional regulator [Polyangium mundeleinium]|uniref:LysR family transcriptional regulator n=1 Tax=Polyangium mundeleinium TaxID=2995306 RepID=A0ABT5ESE3_9BACT|nr:LysR family transcriptional regulator [Polyangium mundeleinium]MDC0744735.1 LysR family transcriptional regulator [Polyangium mundeleinium]
MKDPRVAWDDVHLFLAVARAGTLSAAGPRLGLTQPTAGRRLRALEQSVGVTLFQRTPRGFRLTEAGEAMFRHAERMEHEAVALERRLFGETRETGGVLRISTSEWFARHVLGPVLAAFTREHPRVTVEVVAESRLLDLDRQEADLVFRFIAFDRADIVQRRLTQIRYGLYAAQTYLDARGAPDAHGGEGHAIVTMDRAFDALADVAWLRARFPGAHATVRSNSRDVQAAACVHGAGLAVLPRVIGDALPLVRLDVGEEPPGRTIWLGYHRDLKGLPRLRALADHVHASVPKTL